MCGIAGYIGLPTSKDIQERLLLTMARRGPDAKGVFSFEDCTLLHSRLAVVDIEGGRQPMVLEYGHETYAIVYNGELYNTEDVRLLLKNAGHIFRGHSDTEVLLHAYAEWGKECLQKLNGIYAFAIWETNARRLFLTRDRMGVKPLFYMQRGNALIFASEIKTILAYPGIKAQLDVQGAAEIILLGPGRSPGCGVFKNVQEVEPGCCGYFADGKLNVWRYWELKDREHREDFEETVETVRNLVTDAILRQTVSDVPVGTFLSGGLDSSIISAICANEFKRQGKRLHTFSVDYVDNDKYFVPSKFQPNSDGHYIRLMQKHLNSEHHWCVLSASDLVGAMEDAVLARDLPGMADVDISLLAFCKKIKEYVTVALSGECADEIFGGYPWYRDPEVRTLDGFPWAQNTTQRLSMLSPGLRDTLDDDYIRFRYEKTCNDSHILDFNSKEERRMKEMVNLNQKWFMQTLLDRKDRMSMYSGLEVRVPFCDHRIAEYLYGVPWAFKDHMNKEKGLLRCAMEGLLPQEVLWRKKSPYPKTYDPKYLSLVSDMLKEILRKKDSPLFELLDRDSAAALLESDYVWPWYGQLMKKPQTICYILQIEFWLRHYDVELTF